MELFPQAEGRRYTNKNKTLNRILFEKSLVEHTQSTLKIITLERSIVERLCGILFFSSYCFQIRCPGKSKHYWKMFYDHLRPFGPTCTLIKKSQIAKVQRT